MASSTNRHITDELLSAYIDNAVTADERQLIEAAIAYMSDANVAWRLESLRHTVRLLKHLPELASPRSFALTVEAVSAQPARQLVAPKRANLARPAAAPIGASRFGEIWRTLFEGGNLFLRNAAAGAALVFLMLIGADFVLPGLEQIELSQNATVSSPATTSVVAENAEQPLAKELQNDTSTNAADSSDESLEMAEAALAAESESAGNAEIAAAPQADASEAVVTQAESTPTPDAMAAAPDADAANAAGAAEAVQRSALPPTNSTSPAEATILAASTREEAAASQMVTASSELTAAGDAADPLAAVMADGAAEQPAEESMAMAAPLAAGDAISDSASSMESAAADHAASLTTTAAMSESLFSVSPLTASYSATASGVISDSARIPSVAQAAAAATVVEEAGASDSAPAEALEEAQVAQSAEAATGAEPALSQDSELLPAVATSSLGLQGILWYAQIIAALCTLGFALLWWRSRG